MSARPGPWWRRGRPNESPAAVANTPQAGPVPAAVLDDAATAARTPPVPETAREAAERAIDEAFAVLGPRHRAPAALLPALDALDDYRSVMARPMRVALVGRVSAGKSTLVNALLGTRRVETGVEELTFNVSRLTYGGAPSVTVHYKDGRPPRRHGAEALRELTVRACGDEELHARLCAIDHLVVTDPSPCLRAFDLVDTPGLDSVFGADAANTLRFLGRSGEDVHRDSVSHAGSADALVLVFARGLAQGEEELLADFTHAGFGDGGALTTVGALTKAELYWPEHPDPLAAGRGVADRVMTAAGGSRLMYDLRPLCSLVAAAAGQLTDEDFADLTALATVAPAVLAKRVARGPYFTSRPYPDLPVPAERRARLFVLLAGYGIVLACGLIREGIDRLADLRAELDERSGLASFRTMLGDHFGARADLIKLRRIVDRARTLPASLIHAPGPPDIRASTTLDRAVGRFVDLEVQQHAFRELTVLRDCYSGRLTDFTADDARELQRVTGEFGTSPADRLGLPDGATAAELRRAALERLSRWSMMTTAPSYTGPSRRACLVLRRSYERLAAELAG